MLRLSAILAALSAATLGCAAYAGPWCVPPETQERTASGKAYCKPGPGARCGTGKRLAKQEGVWTCEEEKAVAEAPAPKQVKDEGPKCAAGEEKATWRGYDVCKPGPGSGGRCGKGRRNTTHHRNPNLIICENDPNAGQRRTEITCSEHERPYYPASRSIKPFCEPVGRCGFARVAVASEVLGRKMCIRR